jgi:putative flippase GtrA
MANVINSERERQRFLRFAAVGALGTVIDFAVMNLLTGALRSPLVIAGSISFVVATMNNFLLNRYWTYPEALHRPLWRQLIKFSIVSAGGLLIRAPILKFIEPAFEAVLKSLNVEAYRIIGYNATLALAIAVVLIWNFFINRYWTFRHVDNQPVEPM